MKLFERIEVVITLSVCNDFFVVRNFETSLKINEMILDENFKFDKILQEKLTS